MFELTVKTHFAAAHQLKMVSEKCENLHGHNWLIETRVKGESLGNADVLVDFGQIKLFVSEIMAELDHKFLNELDFFENKNPSSENIAFYIAGRLEKKIATPGVSVSRVTAWESPDAGSTYIPPA